jgi:arylsulfatase A-like enzyme
MSMKIMNQGSLMAAAAVALLVGQSQTILGAEKRPNVVVILADDQGWGDLSVQGNTNLKTPNIDGLARGGALFDRFYVCSVCAPTRAEFLTGRWHARGGVRGVSTGQERLNADEKTIADAFKAAGYATAAFGKWHNGSQWPYHPNARGFDEYYGFTSGHWGEYFNPPLEHNGELVRGKGYITDDLTEHAMAFIEKNKDRQFFCYVPYNTPHSPFLVPDEYWNRFKDKSITMLATDPKLEEFPVTRCALAMVENIDWNVGRILEKLNALKLADNTIVIYFSDNGPNSWRWNDGMKGRKGSTDEGGVRSPFMMRLPGPIKPGTKVREICGAVDLLPTLTSMAGIPTVSTKPLDGRNITPLVLGQSANWPDRMIFSHQNNKVSVRNQQYRLDDRGALYDMVVDPGQKTDVSKQKPDIASKLSQAVAAWRKEVLQGYETDDRPFPIGYAEFPMTPLPARDGVPHGKVKRSAGAPNSSYFVNWRSTEDTMTWDVEVNTTGEYSAAILYTCPIADAGSTIELGFNGSKLQGKVTPGWDPPLIEKQDRVPRKGESYMKDFKTLSLGKMHLEKGRGLLTLSAVEIPGKEVMDVRLITLTLRK